MGAFMRVLTFLVALFSAGAFAQSPQETHFDFRVSSLGMQAQGAGYGKTLLLGDSIAEGYYWNATTCGAIINAGSGGGNTEMLHARIAKMLDLTYPAVAVVSIGINDAHEWTNLADWKWKYNGIAYLLFLRKITPVFETPLPVEYGKPLGSEYFDQTTLLEIVAHIRMVAKNYGAILNDQYATFQQGGYLPANSSLDGVHPAGPLYRSIHAQRQGAVKRAWVKRGIKC